MTDIMPAAVCCICGAKAANTKEHIFPSCLFNTPAPSNLPPRVPACYECNNGLSKDEELFRVFLAAGTAYENAAGNRMWNERIRPDLKGKRPGLKLLIRSMVKQARLMSESEDFVGYSSILEMNREAANRVLRKIAKGLYYVDTQRVLPNDVGILMDYDAEKPERFISPPLDDAIRGAKRTDLGEGEVTYWRNTVKDNPEESLTWIRFYKDKVFLICTPRQNTTLGK